LGAGVKKGFAVISDLAKGTPCYLINVVDMPDLTGRAIEIERGPIYDPADAGWWYTLRAPWLAERFDGLEVQTTRAHLLPIVPPAPAKKVVARDAVE
jgi:hypothetical protein